MESNDTVKLLRECDAGSKMAVSAIDEVLEKVTSERLKTDLAESKAHHTKLGNEIHNILNEYGVEDKNPNPMAKSMSWIKTSVKLGIDESDSTVADLITDGCNMGVKSLHRYLNQYQAADSKSKSLCNELIDIESHLCDDMVRYL
ncbi:MAG: hypothetical protein Q4F95_05330 [Oscillospiraceae bacterium]|nr:hypothetical protein [Oscillospiraceae bacterium]